MKSVFKYRVWKVVVPKYALFVVQSVGEIYVITMTICLEIINNISGKLLQISITFRKCLEICNNVSNFVLKKLRQMGIFGGFRGLPNK